MDSFPWSELPFDLVQIIIKLSAHESDNQAANLALVCKEFHSWVSPLLYNTCVFEPDYCRPVRPTIPWFEDKGKYIRRLLWGLEDPPLPFLELCPNLEHLSLWVDVDLVDLSNLLPLISNMPLWYLSGNITALTGGKPFSCSDASTPLFQSITHLDLIVPSERECTWQDIEGLSAMGSLTHLLLDQKFEGDVILDILKFCPKIQVLALCSAFYVGISSVSVEDIRSGGLLPKRSGIAKFPSPGSILSDDERVVLCYCNWSVEYEVSARGGVDIWVAAEELIAERRILLDEHK